MHRSSKLQASAAYDKGASNRCMNAAMKVAVDYSSELTAGASSAVDKQQA